MSNEVPKVYFEDGGDTLRAASGGAITADAGSTVTLAGTTDLTGTPKIGGVVLGASAAEIDAVADLSANGALLKVKKITISANFDNTEQDTGWNVPAKAVVLDVFLDVTTADASQTLDVGTATGESGDPNGWLAAVSVNGTGLVKGTLASGGQTKGALLVVDESGSGGLVPEADVASGGKSVVYTGSDTTNTMRGSIYIVYLEIA